MIKQNNLRLELIWLGLILFFSLSLRLLFITSFPTIPISDFLGILSFAMVFRDNWLAMNAWQWRFFSPGLPMILSVIFEFVHGSPETVGRWATAFLTGLIPALPYLLWKDVFRLNIRIVSAILLAVWPGQILFSGVLAQDNWIIFPTVAISVLAVRVMAADKIDGAPVLSALLYTIAVSIRQEMLIILLPAAIIAMLGSRQTHRTRNSLVGVFAISIIFMALIIQRGIATGRYALTTEHFGKSILGTYVPGAGLGWIDPIPYVKSVYPEVMKDGDQVRELDQQALSIIRKEFARRPWFHAVRIFGSTLTNILEMDEQLVGWSLGEGLLPPKQQKDAIDFTKYLLPLLRAYPVIINILFVCSLFFAMKYRYLLVWTSPVLATIILKVGLHALVVSQARYYLIVVALEILIVTIMWDTMLHKENWKSSLRSMFLGIMSVLLLVAAMNYSKKYIEENDISPQTHHKLFDQASNASTYFGMTQKYLSYYENHATELNYLVIEAE